MLTISSLDHIKSSAGILKQSIGTGNRFLEQGAEQESREISAGIYRPAFSLKQAQNARIQTVKKSVLGLFSRKMGL